MNKYKALQQKEIKLDLSNVPRDQRVAAKEEVGSFVVGEIISNLSSGVSPVTGDELPILNKDYAEKEKDGDRTPNLYLDGDLLGALGFEKTSNGIAVGITKESQRPKADGHNHFKVYGKSKLPERRFIAAPREDFNPDIMNGVSKIISSYEEDKTEAQGESEVKLTGLEIGTRTASEKGISVTFEDLIFSEDIVNKLFGRIK